MNEKYILKGFNSGETWAIEQIFRLYNKRLSYFAYSILKDSEAAEDMVQDVFVKLCTSSITFDSVNKLSAYLYTSVRNSSLNFIKHRAYTDNEADDEIRQISEDSLLDNIAESEVLSILLMTIDTLPTECARIMKLLCKGYSSAEIAIKLGLAPSSVRAQKARGLKLLKERLPENIYILFISL